MESGARVFVASVRRAEQGRYRGRLEPVLIPADGTRRDRLTAFLAAEARAFERVIALAPEQWWALFFPIWPDPPAGSNGDAHARAASRTRTGTSGAGL